LKLVLYFWVVVGLQNTCKFLGPESKGVVSPAFFPSAAIWLSHRFLVVSD